MKRLVLRLVLASVALGVIGALVAVAGVVPIKASSGHWAITEWFLQFSKQRSVSTWSTGTHVPDLQDQRLVLRGATHYEGGCRPCHGGPGADTWEPSESMTPDPPPLPERVPEWDVEELFFIVKHGLKFTGMPAFPAVRRDDEIWSIVAFMLALPGMRGDEYRRLAFGEPADTLSGDSTTVGAMPASALVQCGRCHGPHGHGRDGAFPSIAGQSREYLAASLRAYASGARSSGIMQPVAEELDEAAIMRIADEYGSVSGGVAVERHEPPGGDLLAVSRTLVGGDTLPRALEDMSAAIARGEAIALRGVADRKIPACAQCHGPAASPRNPHYPRLAGQYADYIVLQLQLFRMQLRGGTAYRNIMHEVTRVLTPAEMVDVALYYASLGR